MSGLLMRACTACEAAHWPPRSLCPGCGGRAFRPVRAERGLVERLTWREHRPREHRRSPVGGWQERRRVPIASVRSDLGPVIIAWSPDEVLPGELVELSVRGGAALARRPGVPPTEAVR